MRNALALLVAALWWGGLFGVAGLAVPLLFLNLPAAFAWMVASQFFAALMWLTLACGTLVLLLLKGLASNGEGGPGGAALTTLMWVLAGMILALLLEFVVAPHVRVQDRVALWGSAGVALLLLQWLCAGLCLWRIAARKELR